jgi:hypothetical protein
VNPAVEEMHKIKTLHLRQITIHHIYLVAPLLQAFAGLSHLYPITATPFTGRSVIH